MSGKAGSHEVSAETRAELERTFGKRYVRIQTGVAGLSTNRKQRRELRFTRKHA